MVAHRKALTEIADYIVTMEEGRITEVRDRA